MFIQILKMKVKSPVFTLQTSLWGDLFAAFTFGSLGRTLGSPL